MELIMFLGFGLFFVYSKAIQRISNKYLQFPTL